MYSHVHIRACVREYVYAMAIFSARIPTSFRSTLFSVWSRLVFNAPRDATPVRSYSNVASVEFVTRVAELRGNKKNRGCAKIALEKL